MFLKKFDRLRKTIGFRLTVWYSTIFILSSLALFVLAYFLLASSMQQRDRKDLRAKLHEYAARYEKAGLDGLKREVRAETAAYTSSPFLVRFVGKRRTFVSGSEPWRQFDLSGFVPRTRSEQSPVRRFRAPDEKHVLEIVALRFADGALLYVAQSTAGRGKLLGHFRRLFASVFIPMILLGALSGTFLAIRALAPIRQLIHTVNTIYAGEMDVRVPGSNTGDELDELGRLFNRMLEKIATLIQGMRQALDNVAHDLRTPMTRLRGIAELALRSEQTPEVRQEALSDCLEESERVLTMLNMMMDISEAETGTMPLHLEVVPLTTLLTEVVEVYRDVAEDREVRLGAACEPDLCVTADRARLRQAMANLLDNAIKYTPSGGTVTLRATARHQHVALVVEDTGVGISPDDLPKIWDRLYRGDHSRAQRGLGLGLSLVKAIIEAHQGTVEVASTPGSSTAFTVYLPAAASQSR